MLLGRKRVSSPVTLILGLVLSLLGLVLLRILLYPVLYNEFNYRFHKPEADKEITLKPTPKQNTVVAADKNFSVVVPKIGANVKVIANVDPNNSKEYQAALTQGVAHAKGTSFPNKPGNVFLFAHSSDSFLNANAFNAVFYLLNKMQKDDVFYIAYKEKLYQYKVVKTETIAPGDTQHYANRVKDATHTATLMTCWPPATTLRRLVVVGVLL